MRQNTKKFGLRLVALILAVFLVGTIVLDPCLVSAQNGEGGVVIQDPSGIRREGTGGGEPVAPPLGSPAGGNILFEQPPTTPAQAWAFRTSDTNAGYLCLDDFWSVTGDIGDIHWYGFSALCCWAVCDPTGLEFEIVFYQDNGGSPGAPVATFSNVIPTFTYYDTYGGLLAYRFEAQLGMPVTLTNGWVSIQSTYSPNGCWLLWGNSFTGNLNAIQQGANLNDNLAFALTKAPPPLPPNVKYLHAEGGWMNITDPIGTQWHELQPIFSREYHLSSWEDNGDGILSYCDTIDMYEKPDGEPRDYHVENVTITLLLTENRTGEPLYIELEGGFNASVLNNPVGTYWHEIYPNFFTRYHLTFWDDGGELDYCDLILLTNNTTGGETECYVEEVAVDIVVTIKPPPVGGEAYPVNKLSLLAPWIALGLVLAGGISWYLRKRRKAQI